MLPLVHETAGVCDVGRRLAAPALGLCGARRMTRMTAMPYCTRQQMRVCVAGPLPMS